MKKRNENERLKKPFAGKQNGKKKAKKPSKILPIISRLMPYILAVLFVVILFTLVGGLGFSRVLYGLFSTFGSYFILVFLLYHSLMWYYDTSRKICTRRVCCSLVIVLCVSIIQHLACINSQGFVYKAIDGAEVNKPSIFELYQLGADGIGGGAIGGGIAGLFLSTIGKGFTIFVILVVLLFMFLQMFNITPTSIFNRIFKDKLEEKRARKEEARRRAALRRKHKKFRVFDDDESDYVAPVMDERILRAMNERDEYDDDQENNDLSEEFTIQRQSVFSEPQPEVRTSPLQRSASPYRFTAEPVVAPAPESGQGPSINTGEFVLNSPAFKVAEPKVESYQEYEDDEFDDEPAFDPMPEPEPVYEPVKPEPVYEPFEPVKPEPVYKPAPEPANNDFIHEADEMDEPEKRGLFSRFKREKSESEEKPVKEEKIKDAPKPPKKKKKHIFPPIDIFEVKDDNADMDAVNEELQEKARIIVDTLKSFNISTRIVDIARGPTVTRYELMPEAGVKVRSIANLVDDIALYLAAEGIRMECPIPGKSAVGIEVPNSITSMVYLRSLLEDPKFKQAKSAVTCAVGKSISGENVYIDVAKLPHLLVAGATGMGKSVCINSLLISLLYKASPDDLRLILIDPKRVEFAPYNGIPHLLVPVVCDVKKSIGTLQWAVSEMERRFETLEGACVRDIGEYNERVERGAVDAEKLARIVIVIDELYDLKMQVPEIDDYIIRLTQKARAAGIHVIIGTQRPSVDVITGVIKANIPSRIAFRVPAQVDSRTILDEVGAEKLVARGDMLLKPVGALKPIRLQGAFMTDEEREKVTNFLKENSSENYDEDVINQIESNTAKLQKAEKKADLDGEGGDGSDLDEKFYAALEIATDMGRISSSLLQRKLNLGFQRAARIIDQMEELGYIGEQNGSKPRDVLITKEDFLELRMRNSEDID